MPAFDPYYKWLGIPKAEQPPNHYRLLGIAVFESDPDVIEAAADRQMTYVSQCATGEHMKLSQQVLNELSKARVCLLVADKKQAYDARLKAALDEAQKIESSRVPVPIAETEDLFDEVKPVSDRKSEETFGRPSRRGQETRADRAPRADRAARPDRAVTVSSSTKPLAIGGGIAAAVLLVIGFFVSTRQKPVNKTVETTPLISQPAQPSQPEKLTETTEKPVTVTKSPPDIPSKPRTTKGLEVLAAKYGAPGHWTDLTERFQKAATSGIVSAVCNNSLVGSDPIFGVRKYLMLRYRIDGRDFEFAGSDMDSAVVIDTRPNPDVEASPALRIHEAKFGRTVFGEGTWQDVTDQITARITNNQLNVAVRDVVQPRSDAFLLIRWSTLGSTWTSFFHLEDTVVLGADTPAVVNLQKDRQRPNSADSSLVVLEAQYGTRGTWVDLTDRIRAASTSGILAVLANGTTVPVDPVPSKSKHFRIRFLLDGRTFDHVYDEGSFIYLDGRAPSEVPENGLQVLQAYCGQGIYGELQNGQPRMFDIKEHLQSLVRDNQLKCSMGDAAKTIQQPVSPKWYWIRYAFNGEIHHFAANELRPTEIVLP